jgi:hypothetical protein
MIVRGTRFEIEAFTLAAHGLPGHIHGSGVLLNMGRMSPTSPGSHLTAEELHRRRVPKQSCSTGAMRICYAGCSISWKRT